MGLNGAIPPSPDDAPGRPGRPGQTGVSTLSPSLFLRINPPRTPRRPSSLPVNSPVAFDPDTEQTFVRRTFPTRTPPRPLLPSGHESQAKPDPHESPPNTRALRALLRLLPAAPKPLCASRYAKITERTARPPSTPTGPPSRTPSMKPSAPIPKSSEPSSPSSTSESPSNTLNMAIPCGTRPL